MTYHMQSKAVLSKKCLKIDSQKLFPEKLYDVAEDGYLIHWTENGTWVSVADEKLFEDEVMRRYPGFLQIPDFRNLRRLFREYGFDWRVDDETSQYEFSHPSFQKGRPELLDDMTTRRRRSGSRVPNSGFKRKSEGRTGTPVVKRTRSSYPSINHAPRKEITTIKEDDDDVNSIPKLYRASVELALSSPMDGYQLSQQADYDGALSSSQHSSSTSEEHYSAHRSHQRKDFSDLMATLVRNEIENGASDQEDKTIPVEVWTQSDAPPCPTAKFVNAKSVKVEDGSQTKYRNMDQPSSPYNWQWGSPTYYPGQQYYPYNYGSNYKAEEHGQGYGPPNPWAHGAGDSHSTATSNSGTDQSYSSQMTAPYWGYPPPPPWFYPPPQSYGNCWYSPPQRGHYPPQDANPFADSSVQTLGSCSATTQQPSKADSAVSSIITENMDNNVATVTNQTVNIEIPT